MPDVMRRLVERGLPELIVAGAARHPDVAHAAAAFGSLPGGRADAGLPADLGAARPQLMTERAILRLMFENRYWHENDHAQAGGISVLRTDSGLEELGDAGRNCWVPVFGYGACGRGVAANFRGARARVGADEVASLDGKYPALR